MVKVIPETILQHPGGNDFRLSTSLISQILSPSAYCLFSLNHSIWRQSQWSWVLYPGFQRQKICTLSSGYNIWMCQQFDYLVGKTYLVRMLFLKQAGSEKASMASPDTKRSFLFLINNVRTCREWNRHSGDGDVVLFIHDSYLPANKFERSGGTSPDRLIPGLSAHKPAQLFQSKDGTESLIASPFLSHQLWGGMKHHVSLFSQRQCLTLRE